MGKINMGIFYGKKYNSGNRTFSLENGENFIEGTGHHLIPMTKFNKWVCPLLWLLPSNVNGMITLWSKPALGAGVMEIFNRPI